MPSDDVPTDSLDLVASELRRPVAPSAGFDARVMAAVRAEPLPARRPLSLAGRGAAWLVRPRTVRVSPLAGLAAAAGLAGVLVLGRTGAPADGRATAPARETTGTFLNASTRPSGQTVQFLLLAPSAARVTVVGDFNDWNAEATPLAPVQERPGVWSVQVPVAPGRHEYAFVVDGERWTPDPLAPRASGDDFGTPNSVITVAERSS